MEEILSAFPCLRQPRLVGQLALAQGICVCKNSRMFSCLLLGTFQSHSYLALWQCSYCQPVACSLSIGAVQLGHCLKGSCELRSTHLKWLLFLWATWYLKSGCWETIEFQILYSCEVCKHWTATFLSVLCRAPNALGSRRAVIPSFPTLYCHCCPVSTEWAPGAST